MAGKPLIGYCDPLSVCPGDTVSFRVSCYEPGPYRADLVRLICAALGARGPGFREEELGTAVDGEYPGRPQGIECGSYVRIPSAPALESLESVTVAAMVFPTLPGRRRQALIGNWCERERSGFALICDESGALALRIGDAEGNESLVSTGVPLEPRRWVFAAASYDAASGEVLVVSQPLPDSPGAQAAARVATAHHDVGAGRLAAGPGPLLIGAWVESQDEGRAVAGAHFNGKIDSPRLARRALDPEEIERLVAPEVPESLAADVIGFWDFARDIPSERVTDLGPHALHGETINLPTRAVTGFKWSGEEPSWRHAPEQYGAIHFHEDDLYDAGWEADFTWVVPDDLRSGVYAARLRLGDADDYVPFFVRPPRGTTTADVALLIPTASYLSYANHTLHLRGGGIFGEPPANPAPNDATLLEHPEFGLSQYDHHSDDSGVTISSALRPIMNLKAKNLAWQFVADTYLTAWLEQTGRRFDVFTDEDLHHEGVDLALRYRVLITGTHPEYTSTAMLDALEGYLAGGGRLMYMGGNGFYWRIAYHPTRRGVIEVRRAENGTRAWAAEPGESYHAFTGEYGGLWRNLGRAPNRLVGVGFAAQGFDGSTYYRRTAASHDPRADFVFKGIEGDVIGDHGRFGSASGQEIDRYDERLGSPRHALVLATSENQPPGMLRTTEEFLMTVPLGGDPEVRSDLVFFECPRGGAVFATGSIGWGASLAYQGYDNDVARLTSNVLERFLDPTPFELPEPPE